MGNKGKATLRKAVEDDPQFLVPQLKEKVEKLQEALRKIDNWAKAYPSVNNMHHVLNGIKNIISEALDEL